MTRKTWLNIRISFLFDDLLFNVKLPRKYFALQADKKCQKNKRQPYTKYSFIKTKKHANKAIYVRF